MKILKIIIQNLATIENAEIDFSSGPLKNSPLFLICGDTGAGKSTITDAVCLSLYGLTPRFDSTSQETIYLENSTINKTSDARHIMRHGTSKALAATVFEAQGKIYKAEWEVHRAGQKFSGTLQPAKNTLYVIKSSQEEVITDKQKEFSSEIEKLTGLNFDRFIRCVMLAQNQFSKFLFAAADKKSEILQMLTNTDIYEKISLRIYEKYKNCKTEIEFKDNSLKEIQLLSDDEILKLSDEKKNCVSLSEKLKNQIQTVQNKINWKKTFIELDKTLKQKTLEKEKAETVQKQSSLERLLEKQLEVSLRDFSPVKNKLSEVKNEKKLFENDFQELQLEFVKCFKAYNSLREEKNALEKTLNDLEIKYSEFSRNKNLYDNIQAVDSLFDNFSGVNLKINNELSKISQTENKILSSEKELEKLSSDFLLLEKEKANLKDNLDKITLEISKVNLKEITDEEIKLDEKIKYVLGAEKIFNDYDNNFQNLENIETQLKENKLVIEKNKDILKNFYSQRDKIKIEFETLKSLFEAQQLMANKNVEQLRKTLKAGQKCPVCGSTEHPFASYTDEIIQTQLNDIKNRRDEKEKELINSENKIAAKNAENSSLELSVKKLEPEVEPYKEKISALTVRLKKAVDFFSKAENLQLNSPEELKEKLPVLKSVFEERKLQITTLRRHFDALSLKEKNARENFETANQKVENLKNQKQQLENSISVLKNSLNEFLNFKQNLLLERQDILNKLKTYFPKEKSIALIEENSSVFKQKVDDSYKIFKSLENSIEEKKPLLADYSRIFSQSERIELLRDSFKNVEISSQKDFEGDYSLLPQKITELEVKQKNLSSYQKELSDKENALNEEFNALILKTNAENPDWNLTLESALKLLEYPLEYRERLSQKLSEIDNSVLTAVQSVSDAKENLENHLKKPFSTEEDLTRLENNYETLKKQDEEFFNQLSKIAVKLETDKISRKKYQQILKEKEELNKFLEDWSVLNQAFGSFDGKKLRVYAQTYTLQILLKNANYNLNKLTDKYVLTCQNDSLAIIVNDLEMGVERPTSTLSGGESFMVSLCLALGLSDMMQNGIQSQILFIDEGFGTLDENSLNHVITMLEKLKNQGRQVGIISHVKELQERIPAKIRVQKTTGDNTKSTVEVSFN